MTTSMEPSPFDASNGRGSANEPQAGAFAPLPVPLPPVPRLAARVEWPTVALAVGIYAAWVLILAAAGLAFVPIWIWAPAAAWCVAWQTSIQHEVIHGHPTPNARINRWIAGPPLLLWLPFERYRAMHLIHHVDDRLTDPLDDPESFYVTTESWNRSGALERTVLWTLNTLVGRLVLGPLWVVGRFAVAEFRAVRAGDGDRRRVWGWHAGAAVAVALFVDAVCGVPVGLYLVAVVWPATALTLLRSFAEHRPAYEPSRRSAIVESRGPLAWLYLSNNLHALHHERPGLPWFVLPKIYRANRDAVLERNGGYSFAGYREVARRWLLTPRDHPRHPGWRP